MTDEPERIWIDDERPIGGELHVFTDPPVTGAEQFVVGYIRADLAEAIVRAAWERVALELDAEAKTYGEHGYSFSKVALICEAKRIRSLASDPAEVAAILKKAGEDRG
jgi:hypothetical protein